MDKNQAIGLSLIIAIMMVFMWIQQPTQEELEALKRTQDSIEAVEADRAVALQEPQVPAEAEVVEQTPVFENDSLKNDALSRKFGEFGVSAEGEEGLVYIENDVLRIGLSKKGGHPASVQLKEYSKFDSTDLYLFEPDDIDFNLQFFTQNNQMINTGELFFSPSRSSLSISEGDSAKFTMRCKTQSGGYLEYEYSIKGGSYNIGFNINLVDLKGTLNQQATAFDLDWKMDVSRLEKSVTNERIATTIYYAFDKEDIDYLSETKSDEEDLTVGVKWLAFKQQFFSSILYSKEGLEGPIKLKTTHPENEEENDSLMKNMSAQLSLDYSGGAKNQVAMEFYFGPNHYNTLKVYDRGYEKVIPLGWGIFGWVNRYAVIPLFALLSGTGLGYGIIILILTLVIKLVLLPLTYKAYMSTAKMRVLKPEIDELNKKFEGKDDAMAKQQATMALYSKAGANPLGGCLPMVLQMPILIALFRFFPSSIELRHQSFLWADDLSTYDSIYDLPFDIPFYGDHISLFTLLMTVSTIIYTRMNSQMTGGAQMEQMKWMMYLMPLIFLGVFNNYAAGLSYYYFLANITSFAQTALFRQFVDEDKIHAQMQENKKKPKKKSGFQKRLEDMAKQQQKAQKKKK